MSRITFIHKFRGLYLPLVQVLSKYSDYAKLIEDIVRFKWYRENESIELSIDSCKKVCLFVPHVDDDVLGMGGTLNKLCVSGNEISIIYTSDGRYSVFPGMNEETMVQSRIIEGKGLDRFYPGIKSFFLNYKSMEWNVDKNLSAVIDLIDRIDPDVVFFPGVYDRNLDHVKNAFCVSKYVEKKENCKIEFYMYPVQTPIKKNLINCKSVLSENDMKIKREALDSFISQNKMRGSFRKVLSYNRMIGRKNGCFACEVFSKVSNKFVRNLSTLPEEHYNTELATIRFNGSIVDALIENDNEQEYW